MRDRPRDISRIGAALALIVTALDLIWLGHRSVSLNWANLTTVVAPSVAALAVLATATRLVLLIAAFATVVGALLALTSYVGLLYLPTIGLYLLAGRRTQDASVLQRRKRHHLS